MGTRAVRSIQELFGVIWGCRDETPTWNIYQQEVCAPLLQLVGWEGWGHSRGGWEGGWGVLNIT